MTWRKVRRRLMKLVYEGDGVLRRDDHRGSPLAVTAADTTDPTVIDLSSLAAIPSLQRFVVATLLRQLVDDRTGSAARPGLVYLVTLDELNRFAPSGGRDPITRLVEHVAAEMRSQGIILLGAQQQASKVSARVVENAGIRALGKTGPVELAESVWRSVGDAARRKASTLRPDEKLLIQDSFREPMLVHIPFPPWALRGEDAADDGFTAGSGTAPGGELDSP
jgi:DNA helicase HerA-like ATPase